MMKINFNKRGVSEVVTAVILIALVMVAGALVWGIVNSMIKEKIGETGSCFGNFEKVSINRMYTCYDSSLKEMHFSISVGDLEPDKAVVAISGEGSTKSYTIEKTETTVEGLSNYPSRTTNIKLPDKNAGLTYIASNFSTKPDLVEIAPVIGGKQCDVFDSVSEIETC